MAGMIERGNVMDPELAIFLLSELDGMIQSDMMNHAPEEIVRYTDQEQELILRRPHDGIYLTFLTAMIRQTQGEYEGYNNAMESFKEKLETFREWYVAHYDPAETASREYMGAAPGGAGYGFAYLTAYGLAVKHGYQGSEEEWLRSLEGQPGAPGEAARMRFDAERGVIQWGVKDEWYDLFTIEELKDPVVEELVVQVRALAEQAAREKDAANQAANTAAGHAAAAGGHAKTAADAAADALTFAGKAYASEQNAVTAAGDAQVQAETAQGYADRAEAAAKRAEEAAAGAGTGGNGSGSGQNVDMTGYAKEAWVQDGFQPKGDYALASAVPTKVSQLTNDKGYLTEHQDISGKLDTDKLPQAVKDALAQAKASGEFDGEDGDPGRGIKSIARTSGNGAAGTTDTYTITYTDDTTGTYQVRNGANGKDGTAATFEITGATALAYGATPTVTEASGSTAAARKYVVGIPAGKPGNDGTPVTVRSVVESTEDGGTNIVELSDGTIISIKNGRKGADGYELTPADKTTIAEEVADMINSVEYEFMPQDVTFPNPGYRGGDVGSKVAGSNGATVGSWCQLQVKPGETYRVSSYRYYDAPAYVVGDASEIVVLSGKKDGKEGSVIETFTIPENGEYLYINNNQGKFVSLEKEEPVGVSIVAISKSPISYKTIVYDGDSICHGGSTNGGYARLVAEKVGGMYVNEGVGGGRLTTKNSGDTHHSVCDNIVNLPTNADLYCFQGGVNDFWGGSVPLGTYSKSDFTGAVDTTTVCGALESIFRYALVNFLGKPVCFIITHKCSGATYNKNAMGDTFEDYRDAMVGICNKYSIPYYDAFSESGLNGWNSAQRDAFTINADGCHPTVEGYKHFYVPQLISLFERIMPIE